MPVNTVVQALNANKLCIYKLTNDNRQFAEIYFDGQGVFIINSENTYFYHDGTNSISFRQAEG